MLPPSAYFVGMIPPTREQNFHTPILRTTNTFVFDDPEKAGRCLALLASRIVFNDALSLALQASYDHRSSNSGAQQLPSLVGPRDVWACVCYQSKRGANIGGMSLSPCVVFGYRRDLTLSFTALADKGQFIQVGEDDEGRPSQDLMDLFLAMDILALAF